MRGGRHRRSGPASALALALAACPPALGQPADDLVSPVRSSLGLLDAAGKAVERLQPNQAGVLRLTLRDAGTGRAAELGDTRAYVRVLDGEPPSCAARVRMFRATGEAAFADLKLEGVLPLAATSGGNLVLADPRLPPSRNSMAASRTGMAHPRFIADPDTSRIYVQDGHAGPMAQVTIPDLALRPFQAGEGFLHLDAEGPVVIGQDGMTRVRADDLGPGRQTAFDDGPWRVELAQRIPVLRNAAGQLMAIPATRAERARPVVAPAGARVLAAADDGAVIAAAQGQRLHLLTAGTAEPQTLDVGAQAADAWFSPNGRYLILLHAERPVLSVVDVALGRLNQAVSLDARVSDIRFAGDQGFLQLVDGAVSSFPLTSLAAGRAMALTPIALSGRARSGSDEAPAPMARLPEGLGVLASAASGSSIATLTVDSHPAFNGAPPSSAPTEVRGGRVIQIAAVSRGFVRVSEGSYEAPVRPLARGPHLLVLADRKGRFSACHEFSVGDDDPSRLAAEKARLVVVPEKSHLGGETPARVTLRVDGPEMATPAQFFVEIMDLRSHWRGRALVERTPEGQYVASVDLPGAGMYVLLPLAPRASQSRATEDP